MPRRYPSLLALAWVVLPVAVLASPVPPLYRHIARNVGVPETLLYAIALQESQLALTRNTVRPWPWTLNVAGSPARYHTAAETLAGLQAAQAAGIENIDVGIMQVNLRYHRTRFQSLTDAIHPVRNIEAGARILREAWIACDHNWWCATGRYHSGTPARAARYQQAVRRHWIALAAR